MGEIKVLRSLEPSIYFNKTTNRYSKRQMVECQCHCGNIFSTRACRIKNNYIKSCGCSRKIGKSKPKYPSNGISKVCIKCLKDQPISEFNKKKINKEGLYSYCKSCKRDSDNKKYNSLNKQERTARNKKHSDKYKDSPLARFKFLKRSANLRNLEMTITLEQHQELIKDKTCFYCDYDLKLQHGSCLNRVDSTKGYTIDNVKPCCTTCNKIMLDFTKEELLPRLLKIAERL